MPSEPGWWTVRAYCRPGTAWPSALKDTAPVSNRPSSSGRATFIARSAWVNPRADAAQASRDDPASTACSTGAPGASSGDGPSSARAENAVRFSTTAGRQARSVLATHAAHSGAFRLAAYRAPTAKPRSCSATVSAATGAMSADNRCER